MDLFLSLCMIVKNEEEFLEKCLGSVRSIADEIIIVDTGSTDKTKEICRRHQAKVYDFPWTDSFSEARNFGIEKAGGEWILWLDADEELDLENTVEFKKALKPKGKDLWLIPLINYYGVFPPDPNRAYLFASHRLFRNHKGFKFVGNIHEHLNVRQSPEGTIPEIMPHTKIYHYGYMDSVTQSKKKYERNLRLLQKERHCPGYSPWIDYHIASEYYRAEQYGEAFKQINISIMRFLQNQQLPPSLLYKLKYDILIVLGSFDGAWPGIEHAIALYPDYVDLYFYKGIILYAKKEFEEAVTVFRHCLELGETRTQYLTRVGFGGYQAWYFIGRCCEDLGKPQEAVQAYAQTISLYPGHPEAQSRLLALGKHKVGLIK